MRRLWVSGMGFYRHFTENSPIWSVLGHYYINFVIRIHKRMIYDLFKIYVILKQTDDRQIKFFSV